MSDLDGRRVLVAGGAGFLGAHLCRELLRRGDRVVCVDDLSTGLPGNVADLRSLPGFDFVEVDVSAPVDGAPWSRGPFDLVFNAASPASPPAYLARPLETLRVGSFGTDQLVAIALRDGARFVQFSTSEVYGDPLVHPQPESYWGNVNPIGPRSVYDEAKRYAEALCAAHERTSGLDLRLLRIFNTYGPGMRPDDGRVITAFLVQALRGKPLTVFGDGSQTRSFCYVDDLIRGIIALSGSEVRGPVNLGNPVEWTMLELAETVLAVTGSSSPIEFHPLPTDDPTQRRPDITRARELLGWEPQVPLREGVERTASWLRTLG